jgi:hypothetical protein
MSNKGTVKKKIKLFTFAVNETYIFGQEHDGCFWSRPANESNAEWKCLGQPEIEVDLSETMLSAKDDN